MLPAAGVLLVWIWIALRAHAARLCAPAVCAALISLIFTSPLTLYGGMYWEHAPAAFFAAIPLILVLQDRKAAWTPVRTIALGCLSGAGVFLRPEALVCVACAIGVCFLYPQKGRRRDTALFFAGFMVAVGTFLAANLLIYGTPLGQHSTQVVNEHAVSFLSALKIVGRALLLPVELCRYWPSCVFAAVCLPFVLQTSYLRKRELLTCVFVIVASIPLIALIVPNAGGEQWGPRYLLVLAPWCAVAIGLVVDAITQCCELRMKGLALVLLSICLVLGLKINTWDGTRRLAENYRFRVFPALQTIREQPQQFVVVSHQYIAQELAALVDTKTLLRIRDEEDWNRIEEVLIQSGVRSVLFVAFNGTSPPEGMRSYSKIGQSNDYIVRAVTLGE